MAIYLYYDDGKIEGNVTAEGFEEHVKVSSVDFGVSRPITMEAGKMANREVGKPNITEVTLTKKADNSVAALFKESVSGSTGKNAILKFTRTGSDSVEAFMEYSLQDCLVSGYHISAEGDAEPEETITLSFSKCEINYKDTDASNKTGNPKRAGYDLAKAVPL